ncbi:MAG: CPBP family intramembrane metalloprotease [Deltaproteobacteria bacterium]|nr:CPBP family intramembrane metalloprotease [Deltaproteobacteria bacterium]
MHSRRVDLTLLALLAAVAAPALPVALRAAMRAEHFVLWQTLALQVCWCGLAGLVALSQQRTIREGLGLVRSRLGASSLLACLLGTLALSGALGFAVEALGLRETGSLAQLDAAARAGAERAAWLVLLAFGIATGIGEELLLRGGLQRGLARGIGAWSIPAAAVVFGALHGDWVHTPAAFLLGCYLGAVAWLAQSTWAAVACHVANNLAATLAEISPAARALPRPDSVSEAALWLLLALALLWLAARKPLRSGFAPSA